MLGLVLGLRARGMLHPRYLWLNFLLPKYREKYIVMIAEHLSVGLKVRVLNKKFHVKIKKAQWSDSTRRLAHVRIVSGFSFVLQLARTRVQNMDLLCAWRLSLPLTDKISYLCFFFLVLNHALFATATVFQQAEWEEDASACPQPGGWGMHLGGGECSLQPQNSRRKWTEDPSPRTNVLTTKVSYRRVRRSTSWQLGIQSGPQALLCTSAIVSDYFCSFIVLRWFRFDSVSCRTKLFSVFKQSSELCCLTLKELLDVRGQAQDKEFIKSSMKQFHFKIWLYLTATGNNSAIAQEQN